MPNQPFREILVPVTPQIRDRLGLKNLPAAEQSARLKALVYEALGWALPDPDPAVPPKDPAP